MSEETSADRIAEWKRSSLITPGKLYRVALPQPDGAREDHNADQVAIVECTDGVMTARISGKHSRQVSLALSVEARRALAAVLLEGLM